MIRAISRYAINVEQGRFNVVLVTISRGKTTVKTVATDIPSLHEAREIMRRLNYGDIAK